MNEQELIENIKYLVNKYLGERNDLIEMIVGDTDSTKYILYQISLNKQMDYDEKDSDLIKDIAFYYL